MGGGYPESHPDGETDRRKIIQREDIKGIGMRIRSEHSRRSKWWLPKYKFMTAFYYALQYQEWKNEYKTMSNSSKAIRYDEPHVQTTGDSDPTQKLASKRADLKRKMEEIEELATAAGADLSRWLLIGVTQEGASYNYLHESLKMPCSKNTYSDRRARFYFELSKKLENKGTTGDRKTCNNANGTI